MNKCSLQSQKASSHEAVRCQFRLPTGSASLLHETKWADLRHITESHGHDGHNVPCKSLVSVFVCGLCVREEGESGKEGGV